MEDYTITHSDYLNDLGILISNALTVLIDNSLKILNNDDGVVVQSAARYML